MIRTILAKVRRADEKYHLISPNDKIVIGVSGGKDSMLLFYAMSLYCRFTRKKFTIFPVMLDLGFDNFDPNEIINFAHKIGYELIVEDAKDIYPILKMNQKSNKHLPCSICSRMKKANIDKVAKRLGANKVMFAHHADDAIETLFMNMIHGKRIATFAPKMHLSKDDITFIRPFIYCHENEIRRAIREENIPCLPVICPSDHFTERENIKKLLEEHIYKTYPLAKDGFLEMLEDEEHLDIYFDDVDMEIKGHLHFRPIYHIDDYLTYSNFFKKHHLKEANKKGLKRYLIYDKYQLVGAFAISLINHELHLYDLYLTKEKYVLIVYEHILNYFKKQVVPLILVSHVKKERRHLSTLPFLKKIDDDKYEI